MVAPVVVINEDRPGVYSAKSVRSMRETVQILQSIIESYIRSDERQKVVAEAKTKIINLNGMPVLDVSNQRN